MGVWTRRSDRDEQVSSLVTEIERLRQDNVRLRMERQRPVNVTAVVEELRSRARAIGEDAADEAHHALAQVESTRRALIDALDGLTAAVTQIRRQVVTGASAMEIDRRSSDRSRSSSGQSPEVSRARSETRVGSTERAMSLTQPVKLL
jgi:hypothetical protein